MENKGAIVIYRSEDGKLELNVKVGNESVWLTQKQMANIFRCSVDNIGLHLKKIFKEKELDEKSVTEDSSVTATDGKTYSTKHYNLDAIISVGYRVNSKRGTQFRQWATKVLREHILDGYSINKDRLTELENMCRCLNDTVLQTSLLLNKHIVNSARRKDLVILMEDIEKVKKDIDDIKGKLSQNK
jgi:hypothetical protein